MHQHKVELLLPHHNTQITDNALISQSSLSTLCVETDKYVRKQVIRSPNPGTSTQMHQRRPTEILQLKAGAIQIEALTVQLI